jgi:hypothetical protein
MAKQGREFMLVHLVERIGTNTMGDIVSIMSRRHGVRIKQWIDKIWQIWWRKCQSYGEQGKHIEKRNDMMGKSWAGIGKGMSGWGNGREWNISLVMSHL